MRDKSQNQRTKNSDSILLIQCRTLKQGCGAQLILWLLKAKRQCKFLRDLPHVDEVCAPIRPCPH